MLAAPPIGHNGAVGSGSEERVSANETIFREVNERVVEIAGSFAGEPQGTLLDFVCECGEADCTERIRLDRDEYEFVRAEATRFVVVPGHVLPEIERVVFRTDRFTVVEKRPGDAADVAVETEPRAEED